MIKQLEVLMYEERLRELHVRRLAEEPRSMHARESGGQGAAADNHLQIIEVISPKEGEGL